MTARYRIVGAELSPYSVKVRSYFRFKNIPHEWIVASQAMRESLQEHFRLPLIPLVLTPDEKALQDSTPIIEKLESAHGGDTIYPEDPATDFVSTLLEDFGDEWGNKWMFHLRWAREIDQLSGAWRIAQTFQPELDDSALIEVAARIRERMVGRVWFVGSNEQNAAEIESGCRDALGMLESHLEHRRYLFGDRPAFGDFGLWPQLYCLSTDPTPGALIASKYPAVLAWIQRMLWPRADGEFEHWADLEPTLLPFLREQVAGRYLPWTAANAKALIDGSEEFSVNLAGHEWTQKPQKYHARAYGVLREKYASLADRNVVDEVLKKADCLTWLQ